MSQHPSEHNNKKKSAKAIDQESEEMVEQSEQDVAMADETVQQAEEAVKASESMDSSADDELDEATQAEQTSENDKVKIEFPYSELVRSKIPKAFDVAEKVATDWKNQGEFKDLGLPHPLADALAAEALKKAKDVEKKLEEKGVFTMAKMGLEIAKSQINQLRKKGE